LNIIKTAILVSSLAVAGCANMEEKIVINATTHDHKCVAEAIYYESSKEPTAGRHAVAHVVVNRSKSGKFPKSLCEVVYQRNIRGRCQFSWACHKNKTPRGVAWEEAQQIATYVITGKSSDTSNGALFFKRHKDKTGWNTIKYKKTAEIGGHSFWGPAQLKLAYRRQGEIK
jgi:spore germination cell wall hydrolase CwlJ-like protein